jgi:tetratricopeptide (TPR) repeat protein
MLADSLVCQGKYAQAEGLYSEVLIMLQRFQNSEEDYRATAKSLASCLEHQGKLAEAETLRRELLARTMRVHGVDDAQTLLAAQSLAGILLSQGNFADAAEVLWEALMPVSQLLEGSIVSVALARKVRLRDRLRRGRPDVNVIRVAADLAKSLSQQQKHADAEALEREILASVQRLHGEDHEAALGASCRLADTLGCQGKHAEAEALLRFVIPAMKRALGEHHPRSLGAVKAIAGCLLSQGKYAEAEVLEHELLAAQLRVMTEPDLAFNAT